MAYKKAEHKTNNSYLPSNKSLTPHKRYKPIKQMKILRIVKLFSFRLNRRASRRGTITMYKEVIKPTFPEDILPAAICCKAEAKDKTRPKTNMTSIIDLSLVPSFLNKKGIKGIKAKK